MHTFVIDDMVCLLSCARPWTGTCLSSPSNRCPRVFWIHVVILYCSHIFSPLPKQTAAWQHNSSAWSFFATPDVSLRMKKQQLKMMRSTSSNGPRLGSSQQLPASSHGVSSYRHVPNSWCRLSYERKIANHIIMKERRR